MYTYRSHTFNYIPETNEFVFPFFAYQDDVLAIFDPVFFVFTKEDVVTRTFQKNPQHNWSIISTDPEFQNHLNELLLKVSVFFKLPFRSHLFPINSEITIIHEISHDDANKWYTVLFHFNDYPSFVFKFGFTRNFQETTLSGFFKEDLEHQLGLSSSIQFDLNSFFVNTGELFKIIQNHPKMRLKLLFF